MHEVAVGAVRSMVAAVVTAFGFLACGESSRQIHPVWMSIVRRLHENEEERFAAFFEPVTYSWNKRQHRLRVAARKFSEETDADY